jgi:hypothetical protein
MRTRTVALVPITLFAGLDEELLQLVARRGDVLGVDGLAYLSLGARDRIEAYVHSQPLPALAKILDRPATLVTSANGLHPNL